MDTRNIQQLSGQSITSLLLVVTKECRAIEQNLDNFNAVVKVLSEIRFAGKISEESLVICLKAQAKTHFNSTCLELCWICDNPSLSNLSPKKS